MEIRNPTWRLTSHCPGCDQATLVLRTCPHCNGLVAICDNEGAVFSDPRNLDEPFGGDLCPRCGAVALERFLIATDIQIQEAGFRAGEYA